MSITLDARPSSTADLPFYPRPREYPMAPSSLDFEALRQPHHMMKVRIWDGSWTWLIGGYKEICDISRDRRFSADLRNPGFPTNGPAMIEAQQGLFVRWDGEPHRRVRHILMHELGPQAIHDLRSVLDKIVSDAIDRLLTLPRPVDMVAEFASVIPTAAICHLLGVDYEMREAFQQAAQVVVTDAATEAEVKNAVEHIHAFIRDITHRRMKEPKQDNIISRLAHEYVMTGQLSVDELTNIGWLLVVAGHETTTHAIALGVFSFLYYPNQIRLMHENKYYARAVEETMRFWSVSQTEFRRVAVEGAVIGGQLIRAGEGVVGALPAANRDPRNFADIGDPDVFDITREQRHQIGWGIGFHSCIGQGLARLEMQVAFEQLFVRIPTLKLAVPFEKLRFHLGRHQHGLYGLPVAW